MTDMTNSRVARARHIAANGSTPQKRLRLLKVVIQPVCVLEDGDSLREIILSAESGQPFVVAADDWDAYPPVLRAYLSEAETRINALSASKVVP